MRETDGLSYRTPSAIRHNHTLAQPHSGRILPPIEPLGDESPYKTRANWRWMLATFLTGIAGTGLIGGALFTSFDGKPTLTSMPRLAQQGGAALGPGGLAGVTRKGDRMMPQDARIATRNIIHDSSVTKVGNKEFISVKPYVHVVSSLALSTSDATADLPAFNPLKLFSASAEESAKAPKQAQIDSSGKIAVTQAPFNPTAFFATPDDIGLAESELAVLELAQMKGLVEGVTAGTDVVIDPTGDSLLMEGGVELASLGGNADLLGVDGPLRATTEIVKNPGRNYFSNIADKVITVASGDTLSSLLQGHGVTPQEARAIARAMAPDFKPSQLAIGQELRLGFSARRGSAHLKPTRISLFGGGKHIVTVESDESGDGPAYSRMAAADALTLQGAELHVTRYQSRAKLYQSLYETGYSMGLNDDLMSRIIRIHSYDVDFKRQVQAGDSFEIFYEADDKEGNVAGKAEVLYTALTIRGETKKFYRFRTPDDGVVDFYDENGNSAKKFLIRKPMNGGVLRSSFGMRRHPILKYRKMHTGVDFAAPSGTPIVAAGNGIVEEAKYTTGYGRHTVIRHANGYETAYAHQSAFAKGIKAGVRVRQGQVIGYVGSTGLSTGPHLHYEVIVNGRKVDPMRIRVPRGRTLQGRMLASFQREKARIARLMKKPHAATPRIASVANSYRLAATHR